MTAALQCSSEEMMHSHVSQGSLSGTSGGWVLSAIQKQLGLRLEPQKRPPDMLVLEHIDRPTEN
jgi:uncharacterized protein (TIGR03435 family)